MFDNNTKINVLLNLKRKENISDIKIIILLKQENIISNSKKVNGKQSVFARTTS